MHIMLPLRKPIRNLCIGVVAAGLLAPISPTVADPAIVFEHAGFAQFMVDEKDQAFEDALAMIPARIMELRQEIPDFDEVPEPVLDLLFDLVPRPMQLIVEPFGQDPETGMPTVGVVISLGASSQEDAAGVAERIVMTLQMAGAELPIEPDVVDPTQQVIQTPAGPIVFGPQQRGGTWWFTVSFGPAVDVDAVLASLTDVPPGVTPIMRGRLDMRVLSPYLMMPLGMMGGHEGQMMMAQLTAAGFLGPDALAYDFVCGYRENAYVLRTVIERAALVEQGGMMQAPLARRDFQVIPVDATVLALSRWDASSLWASFESLSDYGVFDLEEVREIIAEEIGLDIKDDLLDPIGSTWGWYASGATGGNTLFSSVLLVSLDDEARMRESLEHLIGMANEQAAPLRYVRIVKHEQYGQPMYTLRTPGLPLPVEISFAIQDGYLIAGMMPQAVIAAGRQIAEPTASILDNKRFRQSAPVMGERQPSAYMFWDTEELVSSGYPLLQLVGSAVANGVRSPSGDRADPGLLIPPYGEFASGIRPLVAFGYWEGDDYVYELRSDRSVLVNKAAAVGYIGRSPMMYALGAAMLIPAGVGIADELDLDDAIEACIPQSAEKAARTKSSSQARQLGMAYMMYFSDHEQAPPSLAALMDDGYLDEQAMQSPFGSVSDGQGDYFLREGVALYDVQQPWACILAYDRAMYKNAGATVVCYVDGHTEVLSAEEFHAAISSGENADVDWNLP
ncbi:MAG: hypothetical protein KAS72_00860 [Phycisphaerales bacterium]|nr:hypothetical protein [Phycisphaerales bacterium]